MPSLSAKQKMLLSPERSSGKPDFSSMYEEGDALAGTTGSSRRYARILKHTVMNVPVTPVDAPLSPSHGGMSIGRRNNEESLLNFENSIQQSIFAESVRASSQDESISEASSNERDPMIDVAQAPWLPYDANSS